MSFSIYNPEELAKEKLMERFNLDRFDQEDMKRDIAEIVRWYYKNTKNMTLDETRLFCLNFMMNSGMLYMALPMCCNIPILDIDDIELLNMNFETGVSKDLMKYLKGQLPYWEPTTKFINLVLSEIPLKMGLRYDETTDKVVGFQDIDGVRSSDFASKSLVMAAQGCIEMFFQPLGYAFLSEKDSSDKLISWIKKTIQQLISSGYNVCSVVSQQTPTFQKLIDRLGITPEKPYFEVAGDKVFYIFDPVYLLIAVRDLLLNTNLFYDNDKLISWSDIVDVHKQCQVLTEAHINPVPVPKINTKYERNKQKELVAGVFNPIICALIKAKYAPQESGTAIFLRTMFNVFNNLVDDFHGPPPSFTGKARQVEVFKEALSMTQRTQLPDPENQVEIPCFSGLKITLNAIMQLRKQFKPQGMSMVLMVMFNTEQMLVHQEDMQKIIGRKCLTPIELKYAFSKAMLHDLVRNPINDSMSSCIGSLVSNNMLPPSDFVGQDVGAKEQDRLLDSIRSGTFEVLFKENILPTTIGKQKCRYVPA